MWSESLVAVSSLGFTGILAAPTRYLPPNPLPQKHQFVHVLKKFLDSIFDSSSRPRSKLKMESSLRLNARLEAHPGLKKIPPYWYPYTTMAKGRWLNREILEVVSTEFRDRSMEYYVCLFSQDQSALFYSTSSIEIVLYI